MIVCAPLVNDLCANRQTVEKMLMSLVLPFSFHGMLTKTSDYSSVGRFQYVTGKYDAEFETCTMKLYT